MDLQVGGACLGVQGLRLASTGTWPVLTAACLAEQVYMTIVTYSISSGIVRKQVGKPEGCGTDRAVLVLDYASQQRVLPISYQ